MRVSVRLRGAARASRHIRAELELPEGARLADVWAPLDLGEEPDGLLYAVNKEYAPSSGASPKATRSR